MGKRKMSLEDARALVPDDLPDGAYWAMVHEVAGAEYGEAWHELDSYPKSPKAPKTHKCTKCNRMFATTDARDQHARDAHKGIQQ